jgi:hypothetical protein
MSPLVDLTDGEAAEISAMLLARSRRGVGAPRRAPQTGLAAPFASHRSAGSHARTALSKQGAPSLCGPCYVWSSSEAQGQCGAICLRDPTRECRALVARFGQPAQDGDKSSGAPSAMMSANIARILRPIAEVNWTKGIGQKTGKPIDYDPGKDIQTYAGVGNLAPGAPLKKVCPSHLGGNNYWPSSYSPKTKLM